MNAGRVIELIVLFIISSAVSVYGVDPLIRILIIDFEYQEVSEGVAPLFYWILVIGITFISIAEAYQQLKKCLRSGR